MENPSDRKYTKEHEWIKEDGTMGITDHAQHLLTDVVFVELPEIGKKVEHMKPMGVIESVKSVSDIYAPVTGEIIDINKELEQHPEYINNSPFDKGWIAKIKIQNPDELKALMSSKEYDEFIKEQHS